MARRSDETGKLERLISKTTPNEKLIIGSIMALRGANLPITIYNKAIERIFDNYMDNINVVNRTTECFGMFSRCMSIDPHKEHRHNMSRKDGGPDFPEFESMWERDSRFYSSLSIEKGTYDPTGYETVQEKREAILDIFHRYFIERERAGIIPSLDFVIKSLKGMSQKDVNIIEKRDGIKPDHYTLTEVAHRLLSKRRRELQALIITDPFANFDTEELIICGLEHDVLKQRIEFFDGKIGSFWTYFNIMQRNGIDEMTLRKGAWNGDDKNWFEEAQKAYKEAYAINWKVLEDVQRLAFKVPIRMMDADGRYISVKFIKLVSEKVIPLSESMKLMLDTVREDSYESSAEKNAKYEERLEKEREEKWEKWSNWSGKRRAKALNTAGASVRNNNEALFYNLEDLIMKAQQAYTRGEYDEVMNRLNTALEILLKEKLGIPLTKTCKVANIIEVLVKENVGPMDYLKEAQKNILRIDNQGKHIAYISKQSDSITALKAFGEIRNALEKITIALTEEQKKKIYGA